MIEHIVALLMFVGPDIKEHRIQPSMSECLKGKRVATREDKPNIQFLQKQMDKALADIEILKDKVRANGKQH